MKSRIPARVALVALSALAFFSVPAFAEPTLQQVYQAAESGRMRDAQTMMDEVLRDHPKSAKAHYVEADLLAKQGNAAGARNELATAEQLQPGLPFAKPDAVRELKDRITATNGVPVQRITGAPARASFPWGLAMIGLLLVAAIAFFMRRLRGNPGPTIVPAQRGPYGGYGAGPYATPMGSGPMPGGAGSGILGNLATGAAVGAGVVAGEALMHRMLDGGHQAVYRDPPAALSPDTSWDEASNYDMGGNDFGIDDTSSWDDSSGSDWS